MKLLLNRIKKINNWKYLFAGLLDGAIGASRCPGCNTLSRKKVDKKFFHSLYLCASCGLLFRYPNETQEEMERFYQKGYSEPGLTTELPNQDELAELIKTNFANSSKDFNYHIKIFQAIGLGAGSKILDYGANWGYATYQFRRAGFDAVGFELSRARAEFGARLGLNITTSQPEGEGKFDAVYSCHVLEHVPSPEKTILDQLRLVRAGGLVIAHTPNGSLSAQKTDPKAFRLRWGKVHAVLLSDQFLMNRFGRIIKYISSDDNPTKLGMWSRKETTIGPVSGNGLFFVLVKPNT